MLIPDAVAATSIRQVAWLVLSNVAISVLVGAWPKDQLVELLQLPEDPAALQTFAVDWRQRSSNRSSPRRGKDRIC
jgi:hypothetical protein